MSSSWKEPSGGGGFRRRDETSRNSVLLQSNINNTRSDVAHLIRVPVEIARGIEDRLAQGPTYTVPGARTLSLCPTSGR